jgi:hypothetical protein
MAGNRDFYRGVLMGRKQPKGLKIAKYAVVQDQLGVAYLRVAEDADGNALLILNTGKAVELVSMDKKTAKARDLRPVVGVDLLATVHLLMQPQSSDTKITDRARQYLQQIKEELRTTMTAINKKAAVNVPAKKAIKGQPTTEVAVEPKASKKVIKATNAAVTKAKNAAVKETAKEPKKAAAKKETNGSTGSTGDQTWTFVKVGPATGQRAVILEALKEIGGKATRTKLEAALAKKLESSQDVHVVLSLKKKFLIDNGCVKVA